MAVGEEVVPGSVPCPPALLILYWLVVAVPFSHQDFAGRICDGEGFLADGGQGAAVCVCDGVERVDLCGAVVEGHRVCVAC